MLMLVDRVDEWMLSHPCKFDGHALTSVAEGGVHLGKLQDEDEKKATEATLHACLNKPDRPRRRVCRRWK